MPSEKRAVLSETCRDYIIQTNDIPFLCKTCGETNPRESVWVTSHTQKRIYQDKNRCRSCRNAKRSSYGKSFEKKKEEHLKAKFGLTLEAYHTMLAGQGGRCLGCGGLESEREEGSRMWPVDHDHDTGDIRGILCPGCNQALGLVKDNIATLLRLADYLGGV